MTSFLKKLFSEIGRIGRQIFDFVRRLFAVLVVILVVVAVISGFVTLLSDLQATTVLFASAAPNTFLATVQVYHLWLAAAAAAFLGWVLIPDEMTWALRAAFEALRYVATAVVEVVGEVAGALVSSVSSAVARSPIGTLIMAGFGIWAFSTLRGGGPRESSAAEGGTAV